MSIFTSIKIENFTVFESTDLTFSPGINIFIGKNGTGKTHLLKVLYSAGSIAGKNEDFSDKLIRNFLPMDRRLGRLARRKKGSTTTQLEIKGNQGSQLNIKFTNHSKTAPAEEESREWKEKKISTAYIPVKEMLANAPGFRSLYATREIFFEEIYADIIDRAYLPLKRGPLEEVREKLLSKIETVMEGKVQAKGETFFLKNKQGELEFTLLAEGFRKLSLLWLLIQNGTIFKDSVLFWDEPEANLNPQLVQVIVEIMLELHRTGVQIFLATHNYVILKEFSLQQQKEDQLRYYALYKNDENDSVQVSTSDDYGMIENSILDTYQA
ncbi:AAA family ATPase [Heliorestis convoluta]|uniref:AAA family ATPase n=1 Tax=Heliorestis convoluta TaxID=356322 RepID=A0A5Q2MXU5_9FIRM|nr:ATP-binding protein [Heliorestis convoluta]QGG47498.1 AAA family ATPase [Heliorestis convoluta]